MHVYHVPDFPAIDDTVDVITTTGEAQPAADMVGFGKILLVVDGTPCVIIFIPVNTITENSYPKISRITAENRNILNCFRLKLLCAYLPPV